jgi:hypothetical protein
MKCFGPGLTETDAISFGKYVAAKDVEPEKVT